MRTGRILHPQLARALAELGHTDIAMVVDAGFPIPRTVERIDLGFSPGIPSLAQILGILRQELFVEKVTFAEDVPARNPRLFDLLREIYTGSGADNATETHEHLCTKVAPPTNNIKTTRSHKQ